VPSLTPTRERRWVRWAVLPLSFVAHVVALALFLAWSALTASPPKPKKDPPKQVSLRRIDSRTWSANRGAARTTPAIERPVPRPEGQIVDVAPGNDQRPKDAKYVAETNNTVKKETRAKQQTDKYSRATPKTSEQPEAMPSAKGRTPQSEPPPASGVNLAESLLGRQVRPTLLPSAVSGTGEAQQPHTTPGTDEGLARGGSDASEGGGAPNDALDVPEGDGTFLNTREWRYAGFFNRVKQAVSAKWDPNGRLRQKGRGLGAVMRTTVMVVTLRADGSLADCFVQQSSGLEELDIEAMKAFERAAPFSNPPQALVENGVIRFQFGFQVTDEGLVNSPFRFRGYR